MIVIITEMIVILYILHKQNDILYYKYMYSPSPYLLISSMHSLVL